jgi:hypothetical protein
MGDDKIQGEGDYASARRFQQEEQAFVRSNGGATIRGSAEDATDELTAEEREGRARAKSPEEDQRDAQIMKDLGKKSRP